MRIFCMAPETQTRALYPSRRAGDGREVQEGGDMGVPIADSC